MLLTVVLSLDSSKGVHVNVFDATDDDFDDNDDDNDNDIKK